MLKSNFKMLIANDGMAFGHGFYSFILTCILHSAFAFAGLFVVFVEKNLELASLERCQYNIKKCCFTIK